MEDYLKYLIPLETISFEYNSFLRNFQQDYNTSSELEHRKKQIIDAIEKLKLNHENPKKFEYDFINMFPNQEHIIQSILEETKEYKKPSEILDQFFTLNYPGLYYDEILDMNFYKPQNKIKELDIESMFLRIIDEDIKVSEKFITRYLKSKERIYFYNPLKDYFNTLPKTDGIDHVERLASLFDIREHIEGTDLTAFTKIMLKKYFVRTLYQLFDTGMKNVNKLSLCLFSPPGSGKTTFIKEKFFPPKLVSELEDNSFFTDNFSMDIKDNNSKETMCSNWIIFQDEFNFFANQKHNVSRKDLNDFKKYSGNGSFDIISHGEKRRSNRIASFIFALNPDTFHGIPVESLTNRFFILDFKNGHGNTLPFEQWTDEDIIKLWSQVYELYRNGFDAQLTKEEENMLKDINYKYMTRDKGDLNLLIERYISLGTKTTGDNYTASDLLEIMLQSQKVPQHIKNLLQTSGARGLGRKMNKIFNHRTGFKKITDQSKASKSAYRLILNF